MKNNFCFITKKQYVLDSEVEDVKIELKRNNFEITDQIRLGEDGVVLMLRNFFPRDFTPLEQALELDINFSVKPIELKKLLLADMDSTIISSECIDELAEYAGARNEIRAITKKAMAGKVDFKDALEQRVKLLRGLTLQQLTDCYKNKIHLNKGAKTLVKTMSSLGATSALVSGGFSFFADKVATNVGFDKAYANHLLITNDKVSGTVEKPILGVHEKQKILQKLCSEGNFEFGDVIAVGDGANDVEIIRNAGIGVSYYGKAILRKTSDFKLHYSNLRALLYFQGIKETKFVT